MKSLSLEYCFIGLVTCGFFMFFIGTRIVPVAQQMMALIDKYPAALGDPRAWLILVSLGAWSTMGLVCGVLAQVFNKRVVAALYDET